MALLIVRLLLRPWQTRAHCALLPTKMFPRLPARATFVADTNFVSGTQKMFLICLETSCVRNKCFPVCATWKHSIHFVSPAFARARKIMSNKVSATMCPCLPGPLEVKSLGSTRSKRTNTNKNHSYFRCF